jgi:hypothetical protein
VKPTIKPRSYTSYEQLLRVHVLPSVGAAPLSRLSALQVQGLYAARLEAGSSSTTVNHIHAVFHEALESAVRFGLVQCNVCDLV